MTTPPADTGQRQRELIRTAIVRLRSRVMATVFAMVGGTGLWVGTVWLVVRRGDVVGPHLGLLSNFYPGYTVTWLGAFVGFFYGAVSGAVIGWSVAWVYNRVADGRDQD